jgi:MFS family permease
MSATPARRLRAARGAPLLLALSVGLVLSDSSVVTLALPAILRELDCSVSAVAWVLIAFNLALAVAAVPGWLVARGRPRRAFALALLGFAAASLVCASAGTLEVLIAARVAQGVLGAAVVAAALELLARGLPRRRAIGTWAAAGVLGAAVGPAVGGFLTEAFSWEAMFALQAPIALVALLGARRAAPAPEVLPAARPAEVPSAAEPPVVLPAGEPPEVPSAAEPPVVLPAAPPPEVASAAPGVAFTPLVALALVSAALAAALFLLVIMLIEGWRMSPGEAALVVTAMPLAALVAGRWARDRHRLGPALPGGVLLAGGLAALGLLPGSGAGWTIAPQLAVGAGLGLALGALIGVTVDAADERDALGRPAAWTIAARHAGIVIGLLVLTPIFAADLDGARDPAERAGIAHVLDAPISLKPKIALARALAAEVARTGGQQLPDVDAAFADVKVPAGDRAATQALRADLADELDRAATAAFSRSFLAAALLALLAAGAVALAVLRERPAAAAGSSNGSRLAPAPSLNVGLPAACTIATLLVAGYVALGGADYGPTPVADPCAARDRPAVDKTQRVTLATLDGTACALGRGREELLLALVDGDRPDGVSEDELSAALLKGIDRAEGEGELAKLPAIGLRLAIRTGGALGIISQLLPG